MLALCDLLFLNHETLTWIAQTSDVEKAATLLRELGAKTVIVTLGEEGSFAVSQKEAARMVPFKVNAVDATGAGDCFAAAFCYGYLQGWPLTETMMFASAASALAVTKTGARTGLPTFEEVSCFLKGFTRVDLQR
jgi:sugar/nucleoside kinase (ribokinase family)